MVTYRATATGCDTMRGMAGLATDPIFAFESAVAWDAWLAENHASANGVWIKMAKKASGIPTVTNLEALESALCYGWIDGIRRRFDEKWFLQRYTPRRSRSNWSRICQGRNPHPEAKGTLRG